MSVSVDELNIAVERLITLINQHESSITNLQTIVQFHTSKFDRVQSNDTAISELNKKLDKLTSTVNGFANRLQLIESRLNIVELDATSDHQLDGHNQEVVRDWLMEADVGINTDMIPLTDTDITSRFEKYKTRRR